MRSQKSLIHKFIGLPEVDAAGICHIIAFMLRSNDERGGMMAIMVAGT